MDVAELVRVLLTTSEIDAMLSNLENKVEMSAMSTDISQMLTRWSKRKAEWMTMQFNHSITSCRLQNGYHTPCTPEGKKNVNAAIILGSRA